MDPDFEAILQTFAAEAEDCLRTIDEGLVALEQHPDDDETLATIFRMAHTIKGNAASLGFDTLTEFTHGFEEVLDGLRRKAVLVEPRLVTLLLSSVDAVRDLLASAFKGEPSMSPAHRSLLERLAAAATPKETAKAPQGERAAAGERAQSPAGRGRATLRVDVDRLDRMLELVGEIAIERARMQGLLESSSSWVAERHAEADGLHAQLRELVLRLRMVPIAPLFRQQVRAVRDLAAVVGKQVQLALEGEDEEMDTAIVEGLKDPLTHMIRNAVDHGIEPAEARRLAGKDPTGTVTLRARHEGGGIVVQIADDGGGLDGEAIARRAREHGLADHPEALEPEQLHALIFEPGFSTAASVTDVSGRGVGMDVVMKRVKALRGTIAISSERGRGTTFTLRLPLTVALIDGFAVTAANETYVVPLEHVARCIELPPAAERPKGNVVDVEGAPVPYLRLREVFNLRAPAATQRESVVVLENDHARAGLAVDELLGVTQVLMKSPGPLLGGSAGIAGSTILGTGQVAFILDVPGLLRIATPSAGTPGGA